MITWLIYQTGLYLLFIYIFNQTIWFFSIQESDPQALLDWPARDLPVFFFTNITQLVCSGQWVLSSSRSKQNTFGHLRRVINLFNWSYWRTNKAHNIKKLREVRLDQCLVVVVQVWRANAPQMIKRIMHEFPWITIFVSRVRPHYEWPKDRYSR